MSISKIENNDTINTGREKTNIIIDILNNSLDENNDLNFLSKIFLNDEDEASINFLHNDYLKLISGPGISFEYDDIEKSLTINSEINIDSGIKNTITYWSDNNVLSSLNFLKKVNNTQMAFGDYDNAYWFILKSISSKRGGLMFNKDDELKYVMFVEANNFDFKLQKFNGTNYIDVLNYNFSDERLFINNLKVNNILISPHLYIGNSFNNIRFSESNILELSTHYSALKFRARTDTVKDTNDYEGFEFVLNASDDGKFLVDGRAVKWIFDPTGYFGWFRVEWDEGNAGEDINWKELFFIGNYQAHFPTQRISIPYITMGQFLNIKKCELEFDNDNNVTGIQIKDPDGTVFFMGNSNINENLGNVSSQGLAELIAERVWNAVFNDLADFQKINKDEKIEYGKCYCLGEDGLRMTNSYCQKGVIGIASDTFGLSMGMKFNERQIPIAVAGWCLAYVRNPETLEQGDPLTSDFDGYLVKISEEDKVKYPERIVAIFDRIENKEEWEGIEVKGRSWVKII